MQLLEILGKIGFDWKLALANLVNFLLIFYILKRFVFGPVQKAINERKAKIDTGLDSGKRAEAELVAIQARREEMLHEARIDGNNIINRAHTRADEVISQARTDAETEKQSVLERGQKQLQSEREEMEQEVRGQSAKLVISGMSQILKEDLDENMHERIVGRMTKTKINTK